MRNKLTYIYLLIFMMFIIGYSTNQAYSYMEGTHQDINEEAGNILLNGFSLDIYLKNSIGYSSGIEKTLIGVDSEGIASTKTAIEWLRYGGLQEDRPGSLLDYITDEPSRSVNHFHNPLKQWSNAGLNDSIKIRIFVPLPQWLTKVYSGQSSVLWTQNPIQNVGGEWSWWDAREYFYVALTGRNFYTGNVVDTLPDETEKEKRERYFTNTLRAVGQQMHLVEDASVPAHVRNSIHLPDIIHPHYEQKVEEFRTKSKYISLWNDILANPITFDKSILDIPADPSNPSTETLPVLSVARIIDTDLFNDNPDVTMTLQNSPQYIGIAEYTNANFLSKDTMFTYPDFNYPNISNTVLWIGSNNREYIAKVGAGDTINHLAVSSWLYPFRVMYFPQITEYIPVGLDEECYKEYAQKLVPRAIGYSAGLLDYFFRGTLEITPPNKVAYSVTDGSVTQYTDNGNLHQSFTHIKAKVRNTTDGEAIGLGTLIAVAKYKIIPNYTYDLSNYPPDGFIMHLTGYTYSVSARNVLTQAEINALNASEPTAEFIFDFTGYDQNRPGIPAGITDLSLQIIFKGTLGNEAGAIAVGMKDLMEPTHQVLWNATDMFNLDGHLYTSDVIKNNPLYADRVDFDNDGIFNEIETENGQEPHIDPHDMTFKIGYINGPPDPDDPVDVYFSATTVVQPGRHIRLISLMDKSLGNWMVQQEEDEIVPLDPLMFFNSFSGVINQEDNGVWQTPTPMTTFRYGLDTDGITQIPIRQHYDTALYRCYPIEGSDPQGNPYCNYPESEADAVDELLPSPIDTVSFP